MRIEKYKLEMELHEETSPRLNDKCPKAVKSFFFFLDFDTKFIFQRYSHIYNGGGSCTGLVFGFLGFADD